MNQNVFKLIEFSKPMVSFGISKILFLLPT